MNDFCLCYKGIHASFEKSVSIVNKDKKAVILNVFGKFVETDGKNAVIGNIVEKNNGFITGKYKNGSVEFDKVVDYLMSSSKEKIAEEIISVRNLIAFESQTKSKEIKNKIKLTKRENEILTLICKGFTNSKIAKKLFISNRTVDNHRANILAKTDTKNTAALVAFAIINKLVVL